MKNMIKNNMENINTEGVDIAGLCVDFLGVLSKKIPECRDVSYNTTIKSFKRNIVFPYNQGKSVGKKEINKFSRTIIDQYRKYYVNNRKNNKIIREEVNKLINCFFDTIEEEKK